MRGIPAPSFELHPVGLVRSALNRREDCPRQGIEGGPEADLLIDPAFAEGLAGLEPGTALILLTWLHLGRRDVLKVHPKADPSADLKGVFLTRSPDRPNPIGLHRVRVLSVEGCRLRVAPLEVLDGTPLADIKIAIDGEA
jgi:tRNA-Thr(GGU) m(6)t(6)A37 methyltransferase TsaA